MLISSKFIIILVMLFSVCFPLGLLIWWKHKTGVSLSCFITGAVIFIVFAMILESMLHQFCLAGDHAISRAIQGSPILYMLYGAFAAGIFEETGRLFAFKVLLKKHKEKACAVAYGIGHGGIEIVLILGVSYLTLLLALMGINMGSEDVNAQLIMTANAITLPGALIGIFERISAMMIQVGLSMFVFTAARDKKAFWLYPTAIFLHALIDAPSVLYQVKVLSSIALVEGLAFVMGLIVLGLGFAVIKRHEF